MCPCAWIQTESSVCGPVFTLLTVCLQFAFQFGSSFHVLGSSCTMCFQAGHSYLVHGSNMKGNLCRLVVWFQSAYILLSVWLQFPCACFQFACRLLPAWSQCDCAWLQCCKQWCVGLWLACSLLTVCFQLGHSLLVFGSSFKPCVCGPGLSLMTVCFQLGHSLLVPVYFVCGLVTWLQSAYSLLLAWSHFAGAWVQCESIGLCVCGLPSLCLQVASIFVKICLCLYTV